MFVVGMLLPMHGAVAKGEHVAELRELEELVVNIGESVEDEESLLQVQWDLQFKQSVFEGFQIHHFIGQLKKRVKIVQIK